MLKKITIAAMVWSLPAWSIASDTTPGSGVEKANGNAQTDTSELAAQIEGTLDDEQREWFILSHGNDSNASFVEQGDEIVIDITGFVDDEAWETQEALSISLTVNNEAQLISAVVIHPLGESISPPLYTSEGGGADIRLTHYERTRQRIHVSGQIKGVLALQLTLDEPPSQEESIEINVEFDVKAQQIEF